VSNALPNVQHPACTAQQVLHDDDDNDDDDDGD
jgi:hypothetical protein